VTNPHLTDFAHEIASDVCGFWLAPSHP